MDGKKTLLYSSTRPLQPKLNRIRGFLALPGELRNHIYQYYFETPLRCELVAEGCQLGAIRERLSKLNQTVKLSLGQTQYHVYKYMPKSDTESMKTLRVSRRLGNCNAVQALRTDWTTSFSALTLASKQVHVETQIFLYNRIQFVFDAPKRISQLLAIVGAPQLELIARLEIHYTTYGSPKHACDVIWQDKHRASWRRAFKAVSQHLKGLHTLKIFVNMNEGHVHCNLKEGWVRPLMQLRHLTIQQKSTLSVVDVDLLTTQCLQRWSDPSLAQASRHLHQLFAHAISLAILGATEEEALKDFNHAWNVTYHQWQYHLRLARTGW